MLLLAQAAADIDWTKLLTDKGPLWAVFAVVLWGAVAIVRLIQTYGPQVVNGHISFMKTAETTQKDLAESFRVLSDKSEHEKTHKQLGHLAEAGKLVMPTGVKEAEAHRHLDKVIAIRDGDE